MTSSLITPEEGSGLLVTGPGAVRAELHPSMPGGPSVNWWDFSPVSGPVLRGKFAVEGIDRTTVMVKFIRSSGMVSSVPVLVADLDPENLPKIGTLLAHELTGVPVSRPIRIGVVLGVVLDLVTFAERSITAAPVAASPADAAIRHRRLVRRLVSL